MNGLAPDVRARRSLIVMTDYLVDRLEWDSARVVRAELPIHVPADARDLEFHAADLEGGPSPEDGFSFAHSSARAHVGEDMVVYVRHRELRDVEGWILPASLAEWWRAVGPGPPGSPERPFALVRVSASAGSITSVWSWGGAVTGVAVRDGRLIVHRGDGERHEHARRENGWTVTLHSGRARSSIELGGQRRRPASPATEPRAHRVTARKPLHIRSGHAPLELELGAHAYRRSEDSWEEAGRPRAVVALSATGRHLVVEVSIEKREVVFRAPDALDPTLDNEHPDIHSDGVQLYIGAGGGNRPAAWLAVPEHPEPRVRTRVIDGARRDIPIVAGWNAKAGGYAMRFEIPLDALGPEREIPVTLDLIVNEMAKGRVRRRGQLVLSGGGGWTYLQGDRQPPARFIPAVIERV